MWEKFRGTTGRPVVPPPVGGGGGDTGGGGEAGGGGDTTGGGGGDTGGGGEAGGEVGTLSLSCSVGMTGARDRSAGAGVTRKLSSCRSAADPGPLDTPASPPVRTPVS